MDNLAHLEALIRSGRLAKMPGDFQALNFKKIPRYSCFHFANLANHADQSRFAFQILDPIFQSEQNPTDLERLEYGEALRRMGLINQAIKIFNEIDATEHPLVRLRLSFCLFNQGRYSEAIPHLRTLVSVTDPVENLDVIAKVNLAAALVNEGLDDEALALIQEVRKLSRVSEQLLLLGACLELIAKICIRNKSWASADKVLDEAEAILPKGYFKYSMFVYKWRAVARSLKAGFVHPDLADLRTEATRLEDFETQRECDLYIGLIARDQPLLHRVYFGTPHVNFRRRVADLAGNALEVPQTYVWNIAGKEPVTTAFDLLSASTHNGKSVLECGRLMHQFMVLLCSDFYNPVTIGTAFSSLFPEEQFAQQGSANRISQLVMRLRVQFKKEKIGLSIVTNGSKYQLEAAPGIGIRVPQEMPAPSHQSIAWQNVRRQLPQGFFSSQDVIRISMCSPASGKRILRWAVESGYAEAVGKGPSRKYRLAA